MTRLGFELLSTATGSMARAGQFKTLHQTVTTPLFMPVGTQATVKAQSFESLLNSGSQILLANTYHLLLRPGPEVFRKIGGIHSFMKWSGSVLTDSGGFQIYSLPHSYSLKEEGAIFRSYVDGKEHLLSPETSIEMQKAIGSDIMMVLDQCINATAGAAETRAAMERTHRWAKRSLAARGDSPQALFGIVQGACHPELRRESAHALRELPFDGFAVGGLAVGEPREAREEITELTTPHMPAHLPRYLMGVGTPLDLLEGIHRGIDMFDCILPNSLAQRGTAFTSVGKVQLRRSAHRFDDVPLDPGCDCLTCTKYSRAYLHHLIKSDEVLGWSLIGAHNIHFYHRLVGGARTAILAGNFLSYYREKREIWLQERDETEIEQPCRGKRTRTTPLELGRGGFRILPGGQTFEGRSIASRMEHIASGEVMHSVNDPQEEARTVYVNQSRLRERGERAEAGDSLVVWDVGLGAGFNAMEALRCFADAGASGRLHIVSFEKDLDAFRLALDHPAHFPHLVHEAPHVLLEKREWKSEDGRIHWTLHEGDFLSEMEKTPKPDLIYYDPFSTHTDSELWSFETFKQVARAIGLEDRAVELFTYTHSTAVRGSLLNAGFFVAHGVPTGPKPETTIALSPKAVHLRKDLRFLDHTWLTRWKRSGAPFPAGTREEMKEPLTKGILGHRQFETVT